MRERNYAYVLISALSVVPRTGAKATMREKLITAMKFVCGMLSIRFRRVRFTSAFVCMRSLPEKSFSVIIIQLQELSYKSHVLKDL